MELMPNQVLEAFKELSERDEKEVFRQILNIQPLECIASALEDLPGDLDIIEQLAWRLKDYIDFETLVKREAREKAARLKLMNGSSSRRRKGGCEKCAHPSNPYIEHSGCKQADQTVTG